MVMESRYGAVGIQDLDLLIETARIEIVAVDRQQANVARRAFRDFGRGRHPAGLNYGDCFAYALAHVRGERLLAKGDDFTKTDLPMVPLYGTSSPTPSGSRATLDHRADVPPGDRASVELNGVAYRLPAAPVAVVCVDGGDPEYLTAAGAAGLIPTITRFMRDGFSATAHSVVPSFTGPNNLSIATGAPPAVHGISGNFYLDRQTGRAVEMTGPELLRSRTIFDVMSKAGVRTAVITAKDKLRRQLGRGLEVGAGNVCFSSQHADRCTVAEHGIDDALGFVGQPLPDMYSPELSLFVLDAGIRFLEEDDPPRLLYLTLTDYVQHTFAPDHPQALEFYHALDQRLARLEQLGATVAVTADHGMQDKCAADGSYRIIYLQDLLNGRFGAGAARVICPDHRRVRRPSRLAGQLRARVLLRGAGARRDRLHALDRRDRAGAGPRTGRRAVRAPVRRRRRRGRDLDEDPLHRHGARGPRPYRPARHAPAHARRHRRTRGAVHCQSPAQPALPETRRIGATHELPDCRVRPERRRPVVGFSRGGEANPPTSTFGHPSSLSGSRPAIASLAKPSR